MTRIGFVNRTFSESHSSDNSTAAENQQERLIKIGWITGYVDGEGCFSINFIRQPHRHNRRGYKTGIQVAHEFAVTQGASSVDSLHLLMIGVHGFDGNWNSPDIKWVDQDRQDRGDHEPQEATN
jgi:hypothetical protein